MGVTAACQPRCALISSGQGSEGSVGLGSGGSGGSVGMSDVGADVGVGCVDGIVGAVVVAAEAGGTGVGEAAIAGTEVRAGASVINGDETGAFGVDEACGRCVGATEPVVRGGCCDASTGPGERAGPTEVRAGGATEGELGSVPDTPVREVSPGTMTRRPTTTPTVAPMTISRSCSIALRFVSKNATYRLHDPTRCALRLPPMIGPVKEATA
jgi:hypothetical protein